MSLHLSQEIAVDISADAIPLKRAPVPGNPADASEWRRLTWYFMNQGDILMVYKKKKLHIKYQKSKA